MSSGQTAKLDLIMPALIPEENQCRMTLYTLGGSLAVPVSEQKGTLIGAADGKNAYRTSLRVDIPVARPGARFLLKVECLAPVPQLLGTVELRVPDSDVLDEIRTGLASRPVQVAGPSRKLRALLATWQISFSDRASPVPDAVVFVEEPGEAAPDSDPVPAVLVELAAPAGTTLVLTAQKSGGGGWKIGARLPITHALTTPEAADDFAEIIHLIHTLETPN